MRDLITEFINELHYQEKSKRTLDKYQQIILDFVKFANDDFSKDKVMEYKQELINKGYKVSTLNNYIIIVNKYLKYIGFEKSKVKTIRTQRKNSIQNVPENTDVKRMLKYALKMGENGKYYLFIKVLLFTGIRIEEIKYFTVESIKKPYIDVNNKGKERTVIVRQDLIRELRKYCRESKIHSGPVFVNPKTKKLYVNSTFWRWLQRIAGKAKVKLDVAHPHAFRHQFAKMFLAQENNNVFELADILGHDSLDTTRLYNVSTNKEKKQKLEKLKA